MSDEHGKLSPNSTTPNSFWTGLQKKYACTYCTKDFGGRSDWERHETTFHEPQYSWQCPLCDRSFNSKRKFSTHHSRDHACGPEAECDHHTQAQKALPSKKAFGCGFQSCEQVLYSWRERCDHVAKHFEDGGVEQNWQYSVMIRNLLRQDHLKGPWKQLLDMGQGHREKGPQLVWREEYTQDLRERLEWGGFDDTTELLQSLYQRGLGNDTRRPSPSKLLSPIFSTAAAPDVSPLSYVPRRYGDMGKLATHRC